MERAVILDQLARSERYLSDGLARLARQRVLIADMRQQGLDLKGAYELFETMLRTQAVLTVTRDVICSELKLAARAH